MAMQPLSCLSATSMPSNVLGARPPQADALPQPSLSAQPPPPPPQRLPHMSSAERAACAQLWHRSSSNTAHAQPRIGMPRSISLPPTGAAEPLRDEPSTGQHHPDASASSALPVALSSVAPADMPTATATVAAPGLGAGPPPASAASTARQGMLARVPLGYAKNAICIEPPKRQRNVTSTVAHSPRATSRSAVAS